MSTRIRHGQAFSVEFQTVETYGIGIITNPAHGDNPNQSFSSRADLQSFFYK